VPFAGNGFPGEAFRGSVDNASLALFLFKAVLKFLLFLVFLRFHYIMMDEWFSFLFGALGCCRIWKCRRGGFSANCHRTDGGLVGILQVCHINSTRRVHVPPRRSWWCHLCYVCCTGFGFCRASSDGLEPVIRITFVRLIWVRGSSGLDLRYVFMRLLLDLDFRVIDLHYILMV
jgi:hypothetical protein